MHLTSSDGQAVLSSTTATLTGGIGFFAATLKTAGPQTLSAANVVSSVAGTSAPIVVTGLAANHRSFDVPLPGFLHTMTPHFYHGALPGESEDDFATRCADELEKLIRPQQYDPSGRPQPLDLLVLSCCQTAAGDDRAALGLAGVAVKSGARSALPARPA